MTVVEQALPAARRAIQIGQDEEEGSYRRPFDMPVAARLLDGLGATWTRIVGCWVDQDEIKGPRQAVAYLTGENWRVEGVETALPLEVVAFFRRTEEGWVLDGASRVLPSEWSPIEEAMAQADFNRRTRAGTVSNREDSVYRDLASVLEELY